MASLLEERPKGSSPKVTAITAPRPILAAEPHHLSRLGDSSQESALTSSQAPATSKPWDNPSEEQKLAEERQRRAEKAEQRKGKEEQRRVKDQLKTLQEVGCTPRLLPVLALACYAVQCGLHFQLGPSWKVLKRSQRRHRVTLQGEEVSDNLAAHGAIQ